MKYHCDSATRNTKVVKQSVPSPSGLSINHIFIITNKVIQKGMKLFEPSSGKNEESPLPQGEGQGEGIFMAIDSIPSPQPSPGGRGGIRASVADVTKRQSSGRGDMKSACTPIIDSLSPTLSLGEGALLERQR